MNRPIHPTPPEADEAAAAPPAAAPPAAEAAAGLLAPVWRLLAQLGRIPGVARTWKVLSLSLGRLYLDDAWAMASHLSLSGLMALFPFLIFVAAVAGLVGDQILAALAAMFGFSVGEQSLADVVTDLLFQSWPPEVAEPLSNEIHNVLTRPHGSILTVSVVVTIYLASNGVEAVRAALNRAYGAAQMRSFVFLRLQSVIFVVIGALACLALGIFGVFGPLIWSVLERWFPALEDFRNSFNLFRYLVVGGLLTVALTSAHIWLPGPRNRRIRLWPGIIATLALWWLATAALAAYLSSFANYVSTYAGLASVVTIIFYLYVMSLILIFGAELNAAIARTSPRNAEGQAAPPAAA